MSTEKVSLILELQDKASKDLQKINNEINKLGLNTQKTDKNLNKVDSSLLTLGKTALGAVGAFVALGTAYDKILLNGVNVNKTFEQLHLSIAALGTVNAEYIAGIDESKTATERFGEAQKFAAAQVRALEEINKVTPHTLQETVQIYKVLLPQVLQYGGSLKDLAEITKLVSLTAAAGSVDFNSLLASVDGLVEGTYLANSGFGIFLKTIGLTPETIKKSDDKLKLITESMQDFSALAPELGKSYDAALSNLSNSWDKLTANITNKIFNDLKPAFAELGGFFDELNNQLTKIEDKSLAQLEKDITKTVNTLAELNKQAEETWLPDQLNMYADRANMVQGELDRMLLTYSKLIEEAKKYDASSATISYVPPLDFSKMSIEPPKITFDYDAFKTAQQIEDDFDAANITALVNIKPIYSAEEEKLLTEAFEAYTQNIKITADEQALQDFSKGLQGILASSLTDGITSALEGDFDAQSLVKGLGRAMLQYGLMLELTSETSVLAGITKGMTAAANPALGAALLGGALLGGSSLFGGGSSKPKMSLDEKADRAFNNLIKAIEENTEILALTKPGTAEAEKQASIKTEITKREDALKLLGLGDGASATDISKALGNLSNNTSPELIDSYEMRGMSKEGKANAIAQNEAAIAQAKAAENTIAKLEALGFSGKSAADIATVGDLKKQYQIGEIEATKDLAIMGDVSEAQAKAFVDAQTKELGLQKNKTSFNLRTGERKTKPSKDSITSANFLEKLDEASVRANNSVLGLGNGLTEADKLILQIAQDSPEAIDALREAEAERLEELENAARDAEAELIAMNDALIASQQNFKNMAASLNGIVGQQQSYIDSTIGLTQSGQDNIAYLENRLALEDKEADIQRQIVADAGTNVTADQIAKLVAEEQDVLDVSKLLSSKATEVYGSTDEATAIINDTLKTVGDNQAQTVTIETAMLEASLASVDQLRNINTKLDALAVNIANEIARAS